MNPPETSWDLGRNGQDELQEASVGLESPMLPYLVGREVTAILEAAQAAADQITAKARDEAQAAAQRITERAREEARASAEEITAGAREQATVVQERIARFQAELADLLADKPDRAETHEEADPGPTPHPDTGWGPPESAGTSEDGIVVEYRREGETPQTGEPRDRSVFAVEHNREAENPVADGNDGEESPAVQLLRQLVR